MTCSKVLLVITNHQNRPFKTAAMSTVVKAVLVNQPKQCTEWTDGEIPLYSYADINSSSKTRLVTEDWIPPQKIINEILSTPHTFYILDRVREFERGSIDLFKNSFTYTQFVVEGLQRALALLLLNQISDVIFTSTPHDIESWLVFHAAYHNSIGTYAIQPSVLPWRAMLSEIAPHRTLGCVSTNVFTNQEKSDTGKEKPSKSADRYVKIKAGDYKDAEPEYMRKQKKINHPWQRLKSTKRLMVRATDLSFKETLQASCDKVISAVIRHQLQKKIERVAKGHIPQGPYLVIFLHYQPERTSIPEGGQFAHPYLLLGEVLKHLPQDWSVLVKEHPSITMLRMARPFRHPKLYDTFVKDGRVQVVRSDIKPFELIDEAKAVITLTGTVGFEAICRGVPVLAFGHAAYIGAPGVVDCRQGLPAGRLSKVVEQAKSSITPVSIQRYLAGVELTSIWAQEEIYGRDGCFVDCVPGETISRQTMTDLVVYGYEIVKPIR